MELSRDFTNRFISLLLYKTVTRASTTPCPRPAHHNPVLPPVVPAAEISPAREISSSRRPPTLILPSLAYDVVQPGTLGRLTALQLLSLRSNNLLGPLPADLLRLPALAGLHLHRNAFSGALPPGLAGLAALQALDLSSNGFGGGIPTRSPASPALPRSSSSTSPTTASTGPCRRPYSASPTPHSWETT
jgi:hypothetical protein